MKQVLATVISNRNVMPETHLIWLDSPQIAAEAKAGQFVMVRCGEDTLLCRPFSVHQTEGAKMALLFAIVGRGSYWLSQCQIGDKINIFGPLGNGFSIFPASKNLLMVAGGIGIAPLGFLTQQALRQAYSVKVLLGASTASQLYRQCLSPSEVELIIATEDASAGKEGLVTDLLPEYVDWADQVFVCGPMSMYRDMVLKKRELKVEGKSVQISLEVRMGCGRGLCYGCTIKTKNGLKRVCEDGPVFNLHDILWDELSY